MPLSKEQILAADDLPTFEVEVPEWGGSVRCRSISADDTDRTFKILRGGEKNHVKLVALCCIDENGNPMFTDEDVEMLKKKSLSAIQRITQAIVDKHPIMRSDTASIEKNS